ncbi:MAG TPA: 30S ribosomal protein S18 [Thermotogota bacterium]|nr:30S ribosomal protein S18 [Thermotogota bacterium]HPJ87534.1 30S ribosomal protein S18 [Thermotogota bacterium]HPR94739.1 30S ribosomal protein S18 [Thermotogota bacterium]
MPQNSNNNRGRKGKDQKFRRRKRRKCALCSKDTNFVDYKDLNFLKEYISDKGRIIPRRINGSCAKHQRTIKTAIKRARQMALLPYTR